MDALIEFSKEMILNYGYWGIFFLTSIEHFIFPIPADVFIAIGTANGLAVHKVLIIVLIAALIGSIIGYYLGSFLGHPAMVWLFGKTRVDKGEAFIKKWGIWAVIGAGLTPFPFKLMTWFAGIFEMPFKKFILGVIIGRMPRYVLTAYAAKFFIDSKFVTEGNMSAVLLGAVQGVTEFLPISSSGHLVILEYFLHVPLSAEQMMSFDVFLHGGSLIAILIFFWKEWQMVFKEIWKALRTFKIDKDSMFLKLAAATIPAIIVGLTLGNYIGEKFRNLTSIGIFFIIVGLLYFYTAWKGKHAHIESVGLKKAVLIGIAQSIALLPGVSRAGSTIATGVALGIKPEVAARFSFMLGAVAILAANVYTLIFSDISLGTVDLKFILSGTITAFFFSLGSIYLLMKFLQKHSMRAFGVYLIIVGCLILGFL